MSLLVNVTLDADTEGGVGRALKSWFDAARCGPLSGCLDRVHAGTAWLSATSQRTEDEAKKEFALEGADGWELMRQELPAAPEWSSVLFFRYDRDRPSAHVRGSSITSRRPNMNLQLWLGGEEAPYEEGAFSSSVVAFLAAALDALNPAFGTIVVDEPIAQEPNLDVLLARKARRSVAEARRQLRGYSWVTVCPGELVDKLGGALYLEDSGAFHKVFRLAAGGVVLQASPTPDGYTDRVMHGVFDVLAPVLPPGMPQFKPARSEVRYIPQDAALRIGQ